MLQHDGDLPAATDAARRALASDTTQIAALRTVALIYAQRGKAKKAEQMFEYAERLTRRDLPTQFWFIEERVAANDINGALDHYDIALRTATNAGSALFPVLTHSVDEPKIALNLTRRLRTSPPWADAFYDVLVGSDVPPAAMANFLTLLLQNRVPVPREKLDGAIRNLFAAGQPALASQVYHQSGAQSDPLIRNSDFKREDRQVPFEWQYRQESGIDSSRGYVGDHPALVAHVDSGATGAVASQALTLPTGIYEMRTDADTAPAEWAISCPGGDVPLAVFAMSSTPGRIVIPPSGCPVQQLELRVPRGAEEALTIVIRKVDIRRVAVAGGQM
jgi:hypothetical protein